MAHEVVAKLDTKIEDKDLKILIKTIENGKTSKLGTLLISKGNLEWLPKGNHVNKRRIGWTEFAKLIETEGKLVKTRKSTKRNPEE